MLMKSGEGLHGIWALTRIIEGIVTDAKGLLPARSKLRLLMQASHVHREGLALWSH